VNPRGQVILEGRLPIDERHDVYRVFVQLEDGVDYVSAVFGAYEGDDRLKDHPLLLYHTGTIRQKKQLLDNPR
jgi:hypothetical protein